MSQNGQRRKWTAADKLRIVLAGMQAGVEVAELCRREGINPTQYYGWKKQLLSSATKVFDAPEGVANRLRPLRRRLRIGASNLAGKRTDGRVARRTFRQSPEPIGSGIGIGLRPAIHQILKSALFGIVFGKGCRPFAGCLRIFRGPMRCDRAGGICLSLVGWQFRNDSTGLTRIRFGHSSDHCRQN